MEHVLVNRQLWTRPTTWVAAGLWALILGMAAAIVAMKTAGWQGAGNTNDTTGVALFLALFAFATMGALVAARVPRNAIGWISLAIPFGGALAGLTENLAFQGSSTTPARFLLRAHSRGSTRGSGTRRSASSASCFCSTGPAPCPGHAGGRSRGRSAWCSR